MLRELGEYAFPSYWENDNVDGAAVFGFIDEQRFGIGSTDLLKDELHEKGFSIE